MRTLISFAALFLSVAFVQLGSGSLAPLDALAGAANGFTTREIGLLGSAHFAGFFVGCWVAPKLVSAVGHNRAFAALAAIGAIAALLHPLLVGPLVWAALRVATGFAVAGAYTVIESWLQAQIDNANRGRVLGFYMLMDLVGSVAAQGLIAFVDPASYAAYIIVGIMCCLCLLPLTMTRKEAPPVPKTPRIRPLKAMLLSPLGVAGVFVIGLTSASFRMVGPVYAAESGLSGSEIALFLALGLVGGAVAQLFVGRLADMLDRRLVLVALSAAALAVSTSASLGAAGLGPWAIHAVAFAFGAASFPIYSVSVAHANDRAEPDFIVELSASLLLISSVGAMISPLIAASLVERYGPDAMFTFVGTTHLFLVVFGVYRFILADSPDRKRAYSYRPRTSLLFQRLRGRRKMVANPGDGGATAASGPTT
jgi:MFS family permease